MILKLNIHILCFRYYVLALFGSFGFIYFNNSHFLFLFCSFAARVMGVSLFLFVYYIFHSSEYLNFSNLTLLAGFAIIIQLFSCCWRSMKKRILYNLEQHKKQTCVHTLHLHC